MDFSSIFFTDIFTGYEAGTEYQQPDFILKTTDGGLSWQRKNNIRSGNVGHLFFPDPFDGYMINSGFHVLKTMDGGDSWSVNNAFVTDNPVSSVFFTTADTGYIAGP